MPILPQSHFEFLQRQGQKRDETNKLSRERLNNLILTLKVNEEFDRFSQTKDPAVFTQNMRKLGTLFNNEKLQSFTVPEYLRPLAPQAVYEQSETGLRKLGEVPKGSKITQKKVPTKRAGTLLPGELAPQETPLTEQGTGQFTGGIFGLGKKEIMEEAPLWNQQTQHVAARIATKDDVIDLVKNKDAYAQQGVDVNALLDYVQQFMLYKPTKEK